MAQIDYVSQFGSEAEVALIVEMVSYQFGPTENILVDFRLNAGRYQMSFQPGPGATGYTVVVLFPAEMVHPSDEAMEFAAEILNALHAYRGTEGETHLDLGETIDGSAQVIIARAE